MRIWLYKTEVVQQHLQRRPPEYAEQLRQAVVRIDDAGWWIDVDHPAFRALQRQYLLRPPDPVEPVPVDVVIPLSTESQHGDAELWYALRSIERNLRGVRKIWLVGHRPPWVTGVQHLAAADDTPSSDRNIMRKLLLACQQDDLAEHIVFWADDQVLLVPLAFQQMGPWIWREIRPDWQPQTAWEQRLKRTADLLRQKGLPAYHYDTHIPVPYRKSELRRVLEETRGEWDVGDGVCVNTWVCNHLYRQPCEPVGGRKATIERPLTEQEIQQELQGCWFLGYNDAGWGSALREVLSVLFPDRPPGEPTIVHVRQPRITKLGIAIPAYTIPQATIQRCIQAIHDAKPNVPYRIHVETEVQERAACRNEAIAALYDDCEVILILDVDCLVPPGLLDWALETVRPGVCVHSPFRKVEWEGQYEWDRWLAVPLCRGGQGAFNMMMKEDWLRIGGLDERLKGWGGEDDTLWWRAERLGITIVKTTQWPFVHLEHPLRGRDMDNAKRNIALGQTVPPRNFLWQRIHRRRGRPWPIPRMIHQCWIGPLPPPRQWLSTWQEQHPDWEYKLWTEKEILSLPLTLERHYHEMPRLSGKINLARYEILLRYGGIYIDADSECVRPLPEELFCSPFVWASYENEVRTSDLIENNIIGAEPGNPFIAELIMRLRETKHLSAESWVSCGPYFVTRVWRETQYPLVVFPSAYFQPQWWQEPTPRSPEIFARHYWGGADPAISPGHRPYPQ